MNEWEQAIQAMVDWIEAHISESPTLSGMSAQISYSPYYCSTQFHAITGMTIREYMMQRRLYHAALELRDTNERILDIAIRYGYSSHEALTTAFRKEYGMSPKAFRRDNALIRLPLKHSVSPPKSHQKGAILMVTNARVHVEFIPAHKYLGVYKPSEASGGEIWPSHDCDLVTSTVQSMSRFADPIVTAHTAGWTGCGADRSYFYGLGMPAGYQGKIPEGFELRDVPASYYLVFSHPPFAYPQDNTEVMKIVEDLAWHYDPKSLGFEWNETECQDYQRHYPEGLGYQVLRPVKKA